MTFAVASRRASAARLRQTYVGARLIDVTSKGEGPWVRFSPFYPHGGIPVPLSTGYEAMSVEGIWQALKVFEHAEVDLTKMQIASMTGLKRRPAHSGASWAIERGFTVIRCSTIAPRASVSTCPPTAGQCLPLSPSP